MCEKEKMLNGQLYNAADDEELVYDRQKCKNLCFEYNNLKPDRVEERQVLIKKIIAKTGQNFLIEQPFMCDYGYNIEIGENFYSNHNLIILDCARVTFGNNVFLGPNCAFYTAGHPLDFQTRNNGLEFAYPIKIGNNVWFGGNVVVLPNVTVGNNVVAAAGAVITKDVPDNSLVAGVPAKVVKKL